MTGYIHHDLIFSFIESRPNWWGRVRPVCTCTTTEDQHPTSPGDPRGAAHCLHIKTNRCRWSSQWQQNGMFSFPILLFWRTFYFLIVIVLNIIENNTVTFFERLALSNITFELDIIFANPTKEYQKVGNKALQSILLIMSFYLCFSVFPSIQSKVLILFYFQDFILELRNL